MSLILRLLERLRSLGTGPAADLMAYAHNLESFNKVADGSRLNFIRKLSRVFVLSYQYALES